MPQADLDADLLFLPPDPFPLISTPLTASTAMISQSIPQTDAGMPVSLES